MSDNKTMIRFYLILLVVSAALTYAVDLNGQFHFIKLNSPLICISATVKMARSLRHRDIGS